MRRVLNVFALRAQKGRGQSPRPFCCISVLAHVSIRAPLTEDDAPNSLPEFPRCGPISIGPSGPACRSARQRATTSSTRNGTSDIGTVFEDVSVPRVEIVPEESRARYIGGVVEGQCTRVRLRKDHFFSAFTAIAHHLEALPLRSPIPYGRKF